MTRRFAFLVIAIYHALYDSDICERRSMMANAFVLPSQPRMRTPPLEFFFNRGKKIQEKNEQATITLSPENGTSPADEGLLSFSETQLEIDEANFRQLEAETEAQELEKKVSALQSSLADQERRKTQSIWWREKQRYESQVDDLKKQLEAKQSVLETSWQERQSEMDLQIKKLEEELQQAKDKLKEATEMNDEAVQHESDLNRMLYEQLMESIEEKTTVDQKIRDNHVKIAKLELNLKNQRNQYQKEKDSLQQLSDAKKAEADALLNDFANSQLDFYQIRMGLIQSMEQQQQELDQKRQLLASNRQLAREQKQELRDQIRAQGDLVRKQKECIRQFRLDAKHTVKTMVQSATDLNQKLKTFKREAKVVKEKQEEQLKARLMEMMYLQTVHYSQFQTQKSSKLGFFQRERAKWSKRLQHAKNLVFLRRRAIQRRHDRIESDMEEMHHKAMQETLAEKLRLTERFNRQMDRADETMQQLEGDVSEQYEKCRQSRVDLNEATVVRNRVALERGIRQERYVEAAKEKNADISSLLSVQRDLKHVAADRMQKLEEHESSFRHIVGSSFKLARQRFSNRFQNKKENKEEEEDNTSNKNLSP